MAEIKVKRTTIKHNGGAPQKKLTARRVVVNNQVKKLNQDANARRAGMRR